MLRSSTGHLDALDGVRGVAVLTVMLYHAHIGAFRGGFLGVDIFFVLSGFLITSLLFREWQQTGSVDLKRFYLRRALRRELGVSPVELAQTHRLLLAKRLLAETALPVTDIAFASGFESLRRFNVAFRERYGMSPSALRRPSQAREAHDLLRITLAYRPPLAWDVLTAFLRREA